MDKDQLIKLTRTINTDYDIGVWSEINSFLEYQEKHIASANVEYDEKTSCYNINIKLNENDIQNIHTLFKDFAYFIEYRNSSFYVREEAPDCINYYLLSAMDNKKGIFSHVRFMQ